MEKMVGEHGVNLFYDSIEYRRLRCHIRKLEPSETCFLSRNESKSFVIAG